jgi:hypothetical protein
MGFGYSAGCHVGATQGLLNEDKKTKQGHPKGCLFPFENTNVKREREKISLVKNAVCFGFLPLWRHTLLKK